jgi:hypothetical protein
LRSGRTASEVPEAFTEARLAVLGAKVFVPLRIGALTLVERLNINFPLMTSLPLDFFKSNVSISLLGKPILS